MIEHCSRSSKTINWSADSFQINHITSMSWHMSPRYGHGIMVSGYPVLTAVNWPYCECPTLKSYIKDGAHYCYCAHFLRMLRWSRATRKKCATRRTRGLVLSPVSLGPGGGSSHFLWKRCVVFQQMKNNFYLPCQFFENEEVCECCYFYVWSIWRNIL